MNTKREGRSLLEPLWMNFWKQLHPCRTWQTSKSTAGASKFANYRCVSDFSLAIIKSYNNIGDINLDIPTDTCSTVTDWVEPVLTLQHASTSVWWCVGHILLRGILSRSVVCKHCQFLKCNSTAILGCRKILRTWVFISDQKHNVFPLFLTWKYKNKNVQAATHETFIQFKEINIHY